MENLLKEKITFLNDAKHIIPIHKGFSSDQKYIVDDTYLIRLFPNAEKESRKVEFQILNELENYSKYVPHVFEFNSLPETRFSYMILTYLPGDDGEVALGKLSKEERYQAGIAAGVELKKLHEFLAPSDTPSWFEQKKRKSDNYLRKLEDIPVETGLKQTLKAFIHKNEHIMVDRPNTFQHDDFHPANLLIHNRKFSGLIDFQRIDWGDPLHDLTKLGFFSVRVSIPFSKGAIDGYFSPHIPSKEFWELYSLYSAMHVVSSLVWAFQLGEEHFKRLLRYSQNVIKDHENFTQIMPSWYMNS